jgi:hypothetical protein
VGTVAYSWTTITGREPGIPKSYLIKHRVYHVPETAAIPFSLQLTIGLIMLLDSISLVHATSLRWALRHEGRIVCNSNPRLFTVLKQHFPTGWSANLVFAIGLGLAYRAISLFTFNVYIIAKLTLNGNAWRSMPMSPGRDMLLISMLRVLLGLDLVLLLALDWYSITGNHFHVPSGLQQWLCCHAEL